MVKLGVQFGLFGGATLHLGTERHHAEYLQRVVSGELFGAFAMSETGHGSNVQAIGTTATYDPDTDEFVVNTPDDESRKDYIGNAAMHAGVAVVFAQLVVGGERRGVTRCSTVTPTSPTTAATTPRREPRPQVLHDARHPRAGPGLHEAVRRSTPARWHWRSRSATPYAGASSVRPTATRRTCSSTTGSTSVA